MKIVCKQRRGQQGTAHLAVSGRHVHHRKIYISVSRFV
uniref:Uncharacterized protein n=1 Tax=Anguilla anguilla TaxID=7936 RepID=A0A0E9VB65_ANGAN